MKLPLLLVGLAIGSLTAQASVKIGDLYYDLDGNEATVTYQTYQSSPDYDALTKVQVPASVEYEGATYAVTAIGDYAFYRCSNLQTLIIPSSVTSIGNWCFYYCDQLNSARIASNVASIGEYCFAWCKSLPTMKMPAAVSTIGRAAFYGCSSLTSVSISEGVTTLPNQVFGFCTNLESVELPSGITSIGDNCFYQCTALTEIALPASLETLGVSSFEMCWGLTELEIPEGVTSVGNACFNDCKNLALLSLPSTLESIGENAFAYTALADVYCYASIPPEISSDSFFDSYSATLHVAEDCENDYIENEYWGQFYNIVADLDGSENPEPGTDPEPADGNKYVLVTSTDQLTDGAKYVIGVTVSESEKYTMSYDSSVSNGRIQTIDTTIDGDYLTAGENTLVLELSIESEEDVDYCYWNIPETDLGLGADSGNYVIASSPSKSTVSFTSTSTMENIAQITFTDINAKNIIVLRSGAFRFMSTGNLTNGAGYGIQLYKAVDGNLPSGIENISENPTAPVEFFNLQGIRVENPASGLYIRRQGSKIEKVHVR